MEAWRILLEEAVSSVGEALNFCLRFFLGLEQGLYLLLSTSFSLLHLIFPVILIDSYMLLDCNYWISIHTSVFVSWIVIVVNLRASFNPNSSFVQAGCYRRFNKNIKVLNSKHVLFFQSSELPMNRKEKVLKNEKQTDSSTQRKIYIWIQL